MTRPDDLHFLSALEQLTDEENRALGKIGDRRFFTSRVADKAHRLCAPTLRALRRLEVAGRVHQADRVSGQPRWSLA